MAVNTALLRKVADRIDPDTRPEGIAGFNQAVYLACEEEKTEVNECDTVCCIAGHAIIEEEGFDWAWNNCVENKGAELLGLNFLQATALLFSLPVEPINENFFGYTPSENIRLYDNGRNILATADNVARFLRELADHMDQVQGERRATWSIV